MTKKTQTKVQKKAEEDANLDDALAETFPASDPPLIVHYLFDYSKDTEYLEVAGPAGTVEMPSPCEAPAVTPWT